MKYEELSKEAQELLNVEFPEELEKEAAETVKQLNELYEMSFVKMAEATADHMDEEDEKEEEEEKNKPEHKLDEEHKKEAAAAGGIMAHNYVEGLMKLGSERHDNSLHYLTPALLETLDKFAAAKVKPGLIEKAKNFLKKTFKGKGKEKLKAGKKDGKTKVEPTDWKRIGLLAGGGAALAGGGAYAYKKHKEKKERESAY